MLNAGTVYFAFMFGLGFLLGTVRVLAVAPAIGAAAAVLCEVPVMLAACWSACGWIVRRMDVRPAMPARIGMGAVAFGLLIVAEALLGLTMFGRSLAAQAQAFTAPEGAFGIGAQVIAALFPLLQMWRRVGRRRGTR